MIPSINRIVHYVLNEGRNVGEHRPAIIVKIWDNNPTEQSLVQLQVFTDSPNIEQNTNDCLPAMMWKTSVYQDNNLKSPGTWHEPEKII